MLERREVEEQWRISRKSELSRLNEVEGKTEEGGGEGKQVAEAERRKCQFIFRNLSFVLIGNTTREGAAKKAKKRENERRKFIRILLIVDHTLAISFHSTFHKGARRITRS